MTGFEEWEGQKIFWGREELDSSPPRRTGMTSREFLTERTEAQVCILTKVFWDFRNYFKWEFVQEIIWVFLFAKLE